MSASLLKSAGVLQHGSPFFGVAFADEGLA